MSVGGVIYECKDQSFDAGFSSVYHLKISLSDKIFSMSIRNSTGELIYFKVLKNQFRRSPSDFLDDIFHADEILQLKFASVEYISFSKRWTLVPAEYLPDSSEHSYIDALYRLQEHEGACRDFVKYLQIHVVFGEEGELRNRVHALFPNCQVSHFASTLLKEPQFNEVKGYFALIELHEDRFFYQIFKEKQLLICNQYIAEHADDVLYFVILVNHSLNISGRDLEISLGGYSPEKEDVERNFREHFPNVRLVNKAETPSILKSEPEAWQEFHFVI